MNICILSYNHEPYIGGIETYSNNLVGFLKSKNINFKLISGKFTKFKIIRILEVIFRFYFQNPFAKYNIVHITSLNLWPVLLINVFLRKDSLVFIVNLHGLELVYGQRNKFLSKLYEFLIPYNFINKQSNIYFLCNSKQTLDLAQKKFYKNKLKFIPMGVDKILKVDLSKEINKNQIFFIGRIVERKGLSWFCENILTHLPNTRLYFAGPIINKHEFQKINSYSQTEYMGTISDDEKYEKIQQSLVTIIPNIEEKEIHDFEGFGITFLEIVANGGLPMATKTQGIISSSLNGRIGLTVESGNPGEWINKIEHLMTSDLNYRNSLIKQNQKLVQENFIWKDIFNLTMNHYEKLLVKNKLAN